MGGAPLKPETVQLIIQTWNKMRRTGEEPIAKEVRSEVSNKIKADPSYGKLPELRTVQEIIREARKKLIKDQSIDAEWTLASLAYFDISADAVPYINKVWRYAINTGEKFTQIQAKWVSRLFRVWEDIPNLWFYSSWYADIERTSILSGEAPNTFTPDLYFFSGWEIMNLFTTGNFENKSIRIAGHRPIFLKEGKFLEELVHYKDIREAEDYYFSDSTGVESKRYQLFKAIEDLPSLDSIGFDEESKMVYLRLYSFLIRCPKWDALSPADAIALILELRQWVLTEYERVKSEPDYVQLFTRAPWPSKIMSKVGYDLPLEEEQK